MLATKWVDKELIENLKLKSKLNRTWRYMKNNNYQETLQEESRQKYLQQKEKTTLMTAIKKEIGKKRK